MKIHVTLRKDCGWCSAPAGSPATLKDQGLHIGIYCLCETWNCWVSRNELGLASRPVSRNGIRPSVRRAVFERDNYRCRYCGQNAEQTVLHVDHIIPVKQCLETGIPKNVMNGMTNLQTLCVECNLGKGSNLES